MIMEIRERANQLPEEMGSYPQRLYKILNTDEFNQGDYKKSSLGEDMELIDEVIRRYWKSRFILNHRLRTAYEWMSGGESLLMVGPDDIDWESMENLPEEAKIILRAYSFQYPSFIYKYKDGVACVKWQLRPDGMYWMDDDGYGMTSDTEINAYGFIDREARVVEKFRPYSYNKICDGVLDRIQARLCEDKGCKG